MNDTYSNMIDSQITIFFDGSKQEAWQASLVVFLLKKSPH